MCLAPKSPQGAPKEHPRAPPEPPRSAQGLPGAPKELPRSTRELRRRVPELPKSLQGAPKSSQELPGSAPEPPRGSKGIPKQPQDASRRPPKHPNTTKSSTNPATNLQKMQKISKSACNILSNLGSQVASPLAIATRAPKAVSKVLKNGFVPPGPSPQCDCQCLLPGAKPAGV